MLIPFNKLYVDQAMYRSRFVFAAWTPEAIRNMDSDFAKRICNFRGGAKEKESLKQEIMANKHLHIKIRRNLVQNLENR